MKGENGIPLANSKVHIIDYNSYIQLGQEHIMLIQELIYYEQLRKRNTAVKKGKEKAWSFNKT